MLMRLKDITSDESGVTIVEVIVSAALMVVISGAVFTGLTAASRAGAQERHQARAYSIAQDDQARIRSLKVSQLTRLSQTSTVTNDGITYNVTSTGTPAIDRATTSACESGNSSTDYIAISSTVTWSSMGSHSPVVLKSIVAPPNGSLDANRGALAVSVLDSQSNPFSGVTINGSGSGSFSGVTGSTGCVIFGDLLAGNYTVTASVANLVDNDGNPPGAITTSVVGQSSNTLGLQYDRGGTANVSFKTRSGSSSSSSLISAKADTITAFNSGMTQAESFGTVGNQQTTISATPLFPFSSPDSIWAGNCPSNNPGGGLALATPTIPVGSSVNATIQLPALYLTVYNGSKIYGDQYGSYYYGTPIANAKVTLTDRNSGCGVKRTLATDSSGHLTNPGLPYGSYDVCASGPDGLDGTNRKVTTSNVVVQDPNNPRSLSVYLYDGPTGQC